MSSMFLALMAFILATLLAMIVTPLVRDWAVRINFVDRPDVNRKNQTAPVALGGGLAVFATTFLVFATFWALSFVSAGNRGALVGLFCASLIIVATGFIDDRYGINGKLKLLMQVVAASVLMGTDRLIGQISVLGFEVEVGVLTYVVTLVWLLAAINSLNLIDGVDGLAANIGLVFATSFGVIALLRGLDTHGVLAFCLAGSLLGFLRYNSAPASIYLGDTGSMLLGLVLGAIAMHCTLKEAATLAFSAPFTIWAIPFFDSLSAILRRKLTGRSIYATDRGHIHHVLLTKGLSPRSTVAIITGLCFVISLATVVGIYLDNEWIGVVAAVLVIGILIVTRLFGHVELVLLNRRLAGLGRYITQFAGRGGLVEHTALSLQGRKDWDRVWDRLVQAAERYDLVALRLNLFFPRQHENFFASWKKNSAHAQDVWSMELPFVAQDAIVGRLKVTGEVNNKSCLTALAGFLEHLESVEAEIQLRLGEPVPFRRPEDRAVAQVETGA